ncbi:MAG: tRNA (adenosine(37)-N6)-threonylcarbamoyltransferase complex dimerization subunit type 1 TsaB [Cyanobacteria bacterium REEB67]|nr:tRNA (adenosine(37)-N6)-threonylcarbamoyltransferase complex dimerization subunit type 1 TsaB [Cyanobacteria bacterium REEB67]
MRLLSFDTSSRGLSVAILENGQILAEANFEGQAGDRPKADRQEAVSLLLPTIDELTVKLGFRKTDYSAIVVGVGPGGFTGVRVAVVTARTLGQALELPVVGINSLEVAAFNIFEGRPAAGTICGVIKEASKTNLFFAAFQKGPSLTALELSSGQVAAQNSSDIGTVLAPAYLPDEEFFASQASWPPSAPITWYAEPQLLERLDRLGPLQPSEHLASSNDTPAEAAPTFQMLTPVNNVAVVQAKIAFIRLSLRQSAFNRGEAASGPLLLQYPYRLVQPLYLRGASVTLKKGDVIERVETY